MIFEYDDNKSRSNEQKHGVNFEDAKALWDDPYAFEIAAISNEEESRFLVLGRIGSKNYTAIITYRQKNIRIISVRKSREKEIQLYESIRP
jgi:hypothetical protein